MRHIECRCGLMWGMAFTKPKAAVATGLGDAASKAIKAPGPQDSIVYVTRGRTSPDLCPASEGAGPLRRASTGSGLIRSRLGQQDGMSPSQKRRRGSGTSKQCNRGFIASMLCNKGPANQRVCITVAQPPNFPYLPTRHARRRKSIRTLLLSSSVPLTTRLQLESFPVLCVQGLRNAAIVHRRALPIRRGSANGVIAGAVQSYPCMRLAMPCMPTSMRPRRRLRDSRAPTRLFLLLC
jgi:hypothetical protein